MKPPYIYYTRLIIIIIYYHKFIYSKQERCVITSGGNLTDYCGGGGRNFNYQDNIETDDQFKCHDTIQFIV